MSLHRPLIDRGVHRCSVGWQPGSTTSGRTPRTRCTDPLAATTDQHPHGMRRGRAKRRGPNKVPCLSDPAWTQLVQTRPCLLHPMVAAYRGSIWSSLARRRGTSCGWITTSSFPFVQAALGKSSALQGQCLRAEPLVLSGTNEALELLRLMIRISHPNRRHSRASSSLSPSACPVLRGSKVPTTTPLV